jgi:dipeptidase E
MKKILLTSTGFDNENIKNKFLKLLETEPQNAKVLFIIAAANDPDSVRILSGCLDDLTKCGIQDKNITIYDLHEQLPQDEINQYDAIYVCGGSTDRLVARMAEIVFRTTATNYTNQGGIYIGVSAGSICASGAYQNGLGFIDNIIDAHCENGSPNGPITTTDDIFLTDNQAIFITDTEKVIFE